MIVLHVHVAGPILNKNMPRVAGILKWCQELRDRVNSGMDKMKNIDNGLVNLCRCSHVLCKMSTIYSAWSMLGQCIDKMLLCIDLSLTKHYVA